MNSPHEDPAHGVEVCETGGGKFQVEVHAGGARFLADEPATVGGLGSGPSPYDLLASALGACTVMTLRQYADRKGWPLRSIRARILRPAAAPGSNPTTGSKDRFVREITCEGDLAPEQQRRLLEIAERCPVHRTLLRGADIATVLAVPPAARQTAAPDAP
jgi:putative redox protein